MLNITNPIDFSNSISENTTIHVEHLNYEIRG